MIQHLGRKAKIERRNQSYRFRVNVYDSMKDTLFNERIRKKYDIYFNYTCLHGCLDIFTNKLLKYFITSSLLQLIINNFYS